MKSSAKRMWPAWLWMLPLLIAVAAIGMRGLTIDSYWFDEIFTLRMSGGEFNGPWSAADIWNVAAAEPFHPPGYHLLVAGWGGIAGWSEFAIRAVSLVCGVLAVAWIYRLGRDVAGNALTGSSSAVLLAFSAFFGLYLHEARPYTLYVLLTVMMLWAYWRYALAPARPRTWHGLLLAVSAAGLLYTHYFAAMIGAALGLYHLVLVGKGRRWWRTLGWMVAGSLLFLPWAISALPALAGAMAWQHNVTLVALMDVPETVRAIGVEFTNASAAFVAVLVALGLFTQSRAAWYFGVVTAAYLLLALLVNARLQLLTHIRYLIGLAPLIAALAALGVTRLAQQRIPVALVLGIWISAGLWLTADTSYVRRMNGGPFWHMPWVQLREEVQARAQDGDLVIMHLPDIVWRWMHDPLAAHYLHGLPVRAEQMESLPGMTDEDYASLARSYFNNTDRLWLAYDPEQPPSRLALFDQTAKEQFVYCGAIRADESINLSLYARIPDQSAFAHFGADSSIEVWLLEALPHQPMPQSGMLNVMLGWRSGPEVPRDTYSVALHVRPVDSIPDTAPPAAQVDSGLPDAASSCQMLDLDLTGLPQGDYLVEALVYDWRTGERQPAHSEDQSLPDRIRLGQITVQ